MSDRDASYLDRKMSTNRKQPIYMDIDGDTSLSVFEHFTTARSAAIRHVKHFPTIECVLWRTWADGPNGREIIARVRA